MELEQLYIWRKYTKVKLNGNIVYSEINGSRESIYNFTCFCVDINPKTFRKTRNISNWIFKIPNLEVKFAFENMIERWFPIYLQARQEIEVLQKALIGKMNEKQ